ncbi:MAG: Maf family nucleotide pyrophosphatase [Desulfuromonadaceae bacterium]|nr:Maf family nucleotide pyrophosphatase [Desulfuromonadaceae bacterium]MDD2854038.1 Maf family nucleotide pyrophosphatase [Desulfuromonadaceae bacterium]
MGNSNCSIVLASASPRRTELMTLAGIDFSVVPADICEDALHGESASDHVLRLSREKAEAVAARTEGRFFIGADTIVVLDGAIIGKPFNEADAENILSSLSGRTHTVITAFTVFDKTGGTVTSRSVYTEVAFKKLDAKEIAAYIATGCPMDKAGAYAMQGGAVHFVRSINGSFSNVIGLPMTELYEVLDLMGALSAQ